MIDINKTKDNMETRSESYIDSESFRDNFEGSEEELDVIANTVYECVNATNENNDTFIDECDSMLDNDYNYLTYCQYCKVLHKIVEIIDERGE